MRKSGPCTSVNAEENDIALGIESGQLVICMEIETLCRRLNIDTSQAAVILADEKFVLRII